MPLFIETIEPDSESGDRRRETGGGRREMGTEFLNVSWGRKTGVDLSLPLFFSMYIKCGIFEQTKTGVVGYLVTSQKLKF